MDERIPQLGDLVLYEAEEYQVLRISPLGHMVVLERHGRAQTVPLQALTWEAVRGCWVVVRGSSSGPA